LDCKIHIYAGLPKGHRIMLYPAEQVFIFLDKLK